VRGFQIKTPRMKLRGLAVLVLFLVLPAMLKAQPWADNYSRAGRSALTPPEGFEPYSGPDHFDYVSLSRSYGIYLSSGEVIVTFRGDGQPPETVRIRFAGSNRQSPPVAEDPLPGVIHYYIGNDPRLWRTDVHRFQHVR